LARKNYQKATCHIIELLTRPQRTVQLLLLHPTLKPVSIILQLLSNTSQLISDRLPTTTESNRMAIPYSSLVFKREIGSGSFGKVFIGEWQRTVVAIKVATMASPEEFTQEAQLSM